MASSYKAHSGSPEVSTDSHAAEIKAHCYAFSDSAFS
jgi:hypothetical protein